MKDEGFLTIPVIDMFSKYAFAYPIKSIERRTTHI
jgi:hypothetical protein